MSEAEGGQGAQGGDQGSQNSQSAQGGGQTPPWEANGQSFDPERAWRLIQNLQGERDGLKTERDGLQSKVSEHEQASMSELEKLTSRVEKAEGQVGPLQSENLRLRAAISAGIDPDDIDRLRGNTLEELVEDAKQLRERYTRQQQAAFDHGPRTTPQAGSMNDLIFGARRGR